MQLFCAFLEKEHLVTRWIFEFLEDEVLLKLNSLLTRELIHGTLGSKVYQSIDTVFLPAPRYLDKATGYAKPEEVTKVNAMRYGILLEMYYRMENWKDHFKPGLLTLKFSILSPQGND